MKALLGPCWVEYWVSFCLPPDDKVNINIVEPEDSFDWCPGMWMNNIYDDYERYCKSEFSLYSTGEVELGINPVFQGRCVAQYNTTHEAEVL